LHEVAAFSGTNQEVTGNFRVGAEFGVDGFHPQLLYLQQFTKIL